MQFGLKYKQQVELLEVCYICSTACKICQRLPVWWVSHRPSACVTSFFHILAYLNIYQMELLKQQCKSHSLTAVKKDHHPKI